VYYRIFGKKITVKCLPRQEAELNNVPRDKIEIDPG